MTPAFTYESRNIAEKSMLSRCESATVDFFMNQSTAKPVSVGSKTDEDDDVFPSSAIFITLLLEQTCDYCKMLSSYSDVFGR